MMAIGWMTDFLLWRRTLNAIGEVKSNRKFSLRRAIMVTAALLHSVLVQSCASRVWNSEIGEADPSEDYVFANRLPRTNAQDMFVVLAFSGGGTRSAAFAYGVLKKLRDTSVTVHGRKRRLLDEVDVISSVSGGSYPAAYYGLFGDRIFADFENRFLKRNVQHDLLALLANPVNLAGMTSADYNRGDLAARWLGDHLFENRTYRDMSLGDLPYVIVNASDLTNGATFSFIQQQFDFLCSSLSNYPVANAVMASSAVPIVFGPISLRNYANDCPQRHNSWVPRALEQRDLLSRRYQVARALERYLNPADIPVLRLVDGGVTDNLGVRGSMMSPVAHYGDVERMAGAFDQRRLALVTQVLVIVANAQIYSEYPWAKEGREPWIIDTTMASFDAALGILNTETVGLAKNGFEMWANAVNASRKRGHPKVTVNFATLTFEQIGDPSRRAYFNQIPTTLSLPDKQVDELSALSGDMLDESPEYQSFVRSLR